MFGRIALFVLTNILVMVTLNIVLGLLGVHGYLTASGIDYQSLMIFCLVWGMGGSLISLLMSRFSAKMAMRVQVIDPSNAGQYSWLVQMTHDICKKAGMTTMPEVGVFQSPVVNAFATGPSKNRSLVAVSTGLLNSMDRDEVAGVVGHEVAHIVNGDMVTMTLVQGVVNAFVMFIARVVSFMVTQNMKQEDRRFYQWMITMGLEMALGVLGMIVVCWFSRYREFRADAGSAKLVGKNRMTAALRDLQRSYGSIARGEAAPASMAAMQISGKSKLHSLFSTHPPLEERIASLESAPA